MFRLLALYCVVFAVLGWSEETSSLNRAKLRPTRHLRRPLINSRIKSNGTASSSPPSKEEELDSLWQLKSGRRMACSDVESSRMKASLRQFKKVWKSAYKRLETKIGGLESRLHSFSEEASVPEPNITNRINATLTDEQKVLALKKLTEQNHPLLLKLTADIDARLGTESRVSIKTDKSLLNKAKRPSILAESPWFRVEHVRDSLRFMTAIRDPGDVGTILGMLLEQRIRLVKIDVKKLLRPKKWGWRFVAFDLRMENGQICEYYLTFEKLARVMFDTHKIYERWRQASVGDKNARKENPAYRNDVERSNMCYEMAFLSSLNEGQYGATTFLERWVEVLERMVDGLQAGVVAPDAVKSAKSRNPHKEKSKHWRTVAGVAVCVVMLLMVVSWWMFRRHRNARLVLKEL